MSYLLDTNVISEIVRKLPNKKVLKWFETIPEKTMFISVLTLGEIRKGIENVKEDARKEKLRLWLENELTNWFDDRILSINAEVADRWGRLLFEMQRPIPAIDSLLAATALHYDLRVVTRNSKDFSYQSLQIVNPWEI